jgi:hypothetical protein
MCELVYLFACYGLGLTKRRELPLFPSFGLFFSSLGFLEDRLEFLSLFFGFGGRVRFLEVDWIVGAVSMGDELSEGPGAFTVCLSVSPTLEEPKFNSDRGCIGLKKNAHSHSHPHSTTDTGEERREGGSLTFFVLQDIFHSSLLEAKKPVRPHNLRH